MKTTRQIKLTKQVQTICEFSNQAAQLFAGSTETTGTDTTNTTITILTSSQLVFGKKG